MLGLAFARQRPIQPFGERSAHDPFLVGNGEKIQLLGKQGNSLAIGTGKLGKISAPEDALRPEGFDSPANLRMERGKRVGLIDIAWKARSQSDRAMRLGSVLFDMWPLGCRSLPNVNLGVDGGH